MTWQFADEPPACTVITALPGLHPVILPSSSTTATLLLLLLNTGTDLFEVSASSLKVSWFSIDRDFLLSLICVFATLMRHDASDVNAFTVIVQFPAFLAVILPYVSTVAIFLSELLNFGILPSD